MSDRETLMALAEDMVSNPCATPGCKSCSVDFEGKLERLVAAYRLGQELMQERASREAWHGAPEEIEGRIRALAIEDPR